MRRLLISTALFLTTSIALAQIPITQYVSNLTRRAMTRQDLPGVAVAVYYGGKAHYYNFGMANVSSQTPITSNTIFEIGSITKTFTATLLALEVQAKVLSLSSKAVNYLPAWVRDRDGAINQVTIQQLATHHSGLPHMVPGLSVDARAAYTQTDFLNYIASWTNTYPIGSRYRYSDIGYGVLGDVLEGATKSTYRSLLQNKILNPLNMTHTYLQNVPESQESNYAQGYHDNNEPQPHWFATPWESAGAIRSTPKDLMKYLEANLGVYPGLSKALNAAIQLTHQTQANTWSSNTTIGLAWFIRRLPQQTLILYIGGTNGFTTYIVFNVQKKVGVIIFSNRSKVKLQWLAMHILRRIETAG